MVRLHVRPDGSFAETVYTNEHPDFVARTNAKLALLYPGTTTEDYSNDEYEAMKPANPDSSTWRRRGNRIVSEPQPEKPHPKQEALDDIQKATTLGELKAAMVKALR